MKIMESERELLEMIQLYLFLFWMRKLRLRDTDVPSHKLVSGRAGTFSLLFWLWIQCLYIKLWLIVKFRLLKWTNLYAETPILKSQFFPWVLNAEETHSLLELYDCHLLVTFERKFTSFRPRASKTTISEVAFCWWHWNCIRSWL